jgi:hypothetical protein
VLTPVHFTQTVEVPQAPIALQVSGKNRVNLIVGSVLAGVAVGATGAHHRPLRIERLDVERLSVLGRSHVGSNHARVRVLASGTH